MKYEELSSFEKEDVEKAIDEDDVENLIHMVIAVSLNPDSDGWAETVCLKLANHNNYNVRGNAILGFGHIARVLGSIREPRIKKIVENAMCEENEYVRGQAHSAAEDLQQFLGWQIISNEK